jgi:hypothetical protein
MNRFQVWLRQPGNRRRALLAAAGVGLLVALVLRRRDDATAAAAPVETGLVGGGLGGVGFGEGSVLPGLDPGIGTPTDGVPTESLPPMITEPDVLPPVTASDVIGAVTDARDLLDSLGLTPQPVAATAPTAPAAAAPKPTAAGFWWSIGGRNTWVTASNLGAFKAELARTGGSLDVWAARHPDAARAVGIAPPASVPAPRPSPSAPVAAPPTSSVAKSSPPPAPPASAPRSAPATAPPPVRYYTYQKDVPLRAGQTIGFTTGRGYYARG